MPQTMTFIIISATLQVPSFILSESGLSFIGLGIQQPDASWGNMLSLSSDQFRSAPWVVYPPGAMIFITVLSVFLVSDGLRDALDPRLGKR